ncbi:MULTISPECIES: DUF5677 domain-containing protein [Lentzea]|uniref:Uncharacterized protein n=2 Tax=Lentzea TaxID=165301 RepID=A0A1W2DEE0_9PSEU|nr:MULTISPECIES: DUF5677 domain-containing protein [Lentzea]MDX8140557.1 DUF5677 domain-containing protein [Lentzea sp. BCCO 10_0061]SMC95614.1 hypothetical protein SAMN05660733_02900 [Lentzea albidocapillata]
MTAVIVTADGHRIAVDVDAVAARHANRLLRTAGRLTTDYAREERRFRKWLWRHWGKALTLYLLAWHETNALMTRTVQQRDKNPASSVDQVLEVLLGLQTRACSAAHDAYARVRGGAFGAALGRCRTLHELAVIARVIGEYGRKPEHADLAERYVLHEKVLAYNDALRHQKHATTLEQTPIAAEELDRLRAEHDELVNRFGPHYRGSYGWAHDLRREGQNRMEFADLTRLAELGHLEPYYRRASHEIHADATGIRFALLAVDEQLLPTGGNTTGLVEPANLALLLLQHCTTSLVLFGINPRQAHAIISLRAIQVLVDRTNIELVAGYRSFEAATLHAKTSKWARLRSRWAMYRLNHALSVAFDRAADAEPSENDKI